MLYSYNPFGPRAIDRLTPPEISQLFANPNCYSEATRIQHQFLIGARGSGKSMLLRRLALSSVLQSQEDPPFLGIYFPIKLTSIEPYLRIWNQTSESTSFEHYFVLNILRSLDKELSFVEQTSNIRSQFESTARDCLSFLPYSSSLSRDIEKHLLYFGSRLSESAHQQTTIIATLFELLSGLSSLWQAESGRQVPVTLLIDNYQELGNLAFIINSMMRKENLDLFCIKAATTTISGLWNQEGTSEPPEYHHDFEIVVVDNDPEDTLTGEFLKAVANNRLSITGLTISELFSIFNKYVRISSGNPDCLCRLCESAWQLAQSRTSGKRVLGHSISKEIQIMAAHNLSKEYYEGEIASKDKDFGPLLQSLVYKVVQFTNSIHFAIPEEERLPSQMIDLLRRGVHKGIFQVATDERKATEISTSFCPRDLRVNSLIIPYLKVSSDNKESKFVNSSQLLDWAFAKVPGQPEFYFPHPNPVQSELWGAWQKAFISSPLKERRPVFISRLRKAIFEVWVSHLQQTGVSKWPPKNENFVEDCYDLVRTIQGDFQYFIDERLAKSSFVVHDVTTLTPGVAYEIGFSRGYKKPSFMVWDVTQKDFTPERLPLIISRGFHIHQLNHKLTSFKNDVDTIIVDPALKDIGNIKCPRHWDKDCKHKEKQEKRSDIGFIYCSKIFADMLENVLEKKMRNLGIRRAQGEELPIENEFCKYHCAICQSEIVLINYSLNDLDSAFLLGLAAGCKSYAIQLFNESEHDNRNRANKGLAMWGGKPMVPWTPQTLDVDLGRLDVHFVQKGK